MKKAQLSEKEFFNYIEKTGGLNKRQLVERIFKHLNEKLKQTYIQKVLEGRNERSSNKKSGDNKEDST